MEHKELHSYLNKNQLTWRDKAYAIAALSIDSVYRENEEATSICYEDLHKIDKALGVLEKLENIKG